MTHTDATSPDAARNATLQDMVTLLSEQHGRKRDLVVGAGAMRFRDGVLTIRNREALLDADGVTPAGVQMFRPTRNFDSQLAAKLGIEGRYLRKLRDQRLDLFDANANGWLHGRRIVRTAGASEVVHPADPRRFLVRAFAGPAGYPYGVARALLSDRYGILDNIDFLTAALDGIRAAGVDVDITGCDLTDDRMFVRINAPGVAVPARELLAGYRSPFTGQTGAELPLVSAGLHLGNSETGGGAWTITPRATFQVCGNGLTRTDDVVRGVHLGARRDEGIVDWSEDTARKELELVTAKTRDAVATFLQPAYVERVLREIAEQAGRPVEASTVVKSVGRQLKFSQATIAGVMDHFIRGGQVTAGGVMQAVTSYAQTIPSAELAHEVETSALDALAAAAAL